jgi:urea transporter
MATFIPQPNAPPIVRSGSHLFIALPPQGQVAYLPPTCVKCGQPATDKPVVKTFSWHHPALYLLIFFGVLVYVIVALIVRKTIRVAVPLCAEHAKRRSLWVTLAWVLPLIGIADAFVLPRLFDLDPGWIVLLVIATILAGIIIWAVVSNPIRPRSIDNFSAEFSGFCDAFLEQFPSRGRF